MIKEKKEYSVFRLTNSRDAKQLAHLMRWRCFEKNNRRRMRIKARKWQIRHNCLGCRQLMMPLFTGEQAEVMREAFGRDILHLSQSGYVPVSFFGNGDGYGCRECRWIMRGGKH